MRSRADRRSLDVEMTRTTRSCAGALIATSSIGLAAGCSFGADKAGGKTADRAVVLTLANPLGNPEELQGFAHEVSTLSGGRLRIDVRSGWRDRQVTYENGAISDVRAAKADLGVAGSRA
jgi:hypothetical protein